MIVAPRRRVSCRLCLLRGRRVLGARLAHMSGMVTHRVAMMGPGQQHTTFEIFNPYLKLDATPRVFTTDSTGDILLCHCPLPGTKRSVQSVI